MIHIIVVMTDNYDHKSYTTSAQYAFQDKSSVYLFTNENIAEYMAPLNLSGARVLTVAASGDHAFEAYLRGASHVDTFDINSYQKNILELKTHMIRNLDYGAFRDFFFSDRNFFRYSIICRLRDDFSRDLRNFLSKYYKTYDRSMFKSFSRVYMSGMSYLTCEDVYRQLARRLPSQINFQHCDIYHLSERFSDCYDLILLSNIFDYLYSGSGFVNYEHRLMQYYSDVLLPLASKNLVTRHGRIGATYIWGGQPSAWTNFTHYLNRDILQPVIQNPDHGFTARGLASSQRDYNNDVILWFHQNHLSNQR